MVVVALRTTEHPQFKQLSYDELTAAGLEKQPSRGTNVRSLADSLGLPRETVRRKVNSLVAAGWIEKQGNRLSLAPGGPVRAEVREALIQMVARHHSVVQRLVR